MYASSEFLISIYQFTISMSVRVGNLLHMLQNISCLSLSNSDKSQNKSLYLFFSGYSYVTLLYVPSKIHIQNTYMYQWANENDTSTFAQYIKCPSNEPTTEREVFSQRRWEKLPTHLISTTENK